MKTITEAQSQTIFYVEDNKVVSSSYYDYLIQFGQGDEPSYIEEKEATVYKVNDQEFDNETDAHEYCEEMQLSTDLIEEITKVLYFHVVRYHANYGSKIKSKGWESESIEEVEDEFIRGLEWYIQDKNWDAPEYFYTHEEAEQSRIHWCAEAMGVDKEVFLSIERKQNIIDARRAELAIISHAKRKAEDDFVFEKYKNIIEKVEGESYSGCQERLGKALPERIQGGVFHRIVKSLRK